VKYREGPWWVPALIVTVVWLAITQAPEGTGHAVRHTIDSGVGALGAAFGDDDMPELPTPEPEGAQ
jgi:hypothetical protein